MKKINITVQMSNEEPDSTIKYATIELCTIQYILERVIAIYKNSKTIKHKYYNQMITKYVDDSSIAGNLYEQLNYKQTSKQYISKIKYTFNDQSINKDYSIIIYFNSIKQIYKILVLLKLYDDMSLLKKYISIIASNTKYIQKIL